MRGPLGFQPFHGTAADAAREPLIAKRVAQKGSEAQTLSWIALAIAGFRQPTLVAESWFQIHGSDRRQPDAGRIGGTSRTLVEQR